MTTLRLFLVALSVPLLVVSCISADSKYPTVAQQDATDVSWGLPARKSRGNPKLRYQYDPRTEAAASMNAAPAAVAPQIPVIPPETISPAVVPASAPTVPPNLR